MTVTAVFTSVNNRQLFGLLERKKVSFTGWKAQEKCRWKRSYSKRRGISSWQEVLLCHWTTGRREGWAVRSSCLSLITKWEYLSVLTPECLIIYFAHFKEGEHHPISFWTSWKETSPLSFFLLFFFLFPHKTDDGKIGQHSDE